MGTCVSRMDGQTEEHASSGHTECLSAGRRGAAAPQGHEAEGEKPDMEGRALRDATRTRFPQGRLPRDGGAGGTEGGDRASAWGWGPHRKERAG